jgi:hypothetical protein
LLLQFVVSINALNYYMELSTYRDGSLKSYDAPDYSIHSTTVFMFQKQILNVSLSRSKFANMIMVQVARHKSKSKSACISGKNHGTRDLLQFLN